MLTYLTDISNNNIIDGDLFDFILSNNRKPVFPFNPILKTTELFFFLVVIESRYYDYHNYGNKNG